MDTMRLKPIQAPHHTLYLLETFAMDKLGVSPGAYRLKKLDELPAQLKRHVGDGPGQQYIWFAWRDKDLTFLITGTMSLERSRERGRPVIEIRAYGNDGSLIEFSTWVRLNAGEWERCHW